MADKIKVTGLVKEQEARTTQDGSRSFHTITIEADDGEVKISDWSGLCKKANILGMSGIFVEAQYLDGQYPRLVSVKQVEKPSSFTQSTVESATAKDAQSFMPAPQPTHNHRPSDHASSLTYLCFKLAVDLTKDEAIQVDKKIERMGQAYEAIRKKWKDEIGDKDE
jgi:hypothetical protein